MAKYLFLFFFILGARSLAGQAMYPGDTNNDGVANHLDLLPIGIAFQVEGEFRPNASEDWFAQQFFPWIYTLPTTPWVNGAYIDSNGDAFIDTLDLDAIVANYDMMQDTAMPQPWFHELPCFSCPPPILSITYDKDSVKVNEPFQAFISVLYPETIPIDLGALGLALELSFDPELVVESDFEIFPNTDEESLMFITANSVDAFGYRLPPAGRAQVSAAGRGQNVFFKDSTLVGTLSFIVVEDIQRDTVFRPFKLVVEDLLFLNQEELLLMPDIQNPDSVVLYQVIDKVAELPDTRLIIYPNPVEDRIHISTFPEIALTSLRLWNAQGTLIRELNPGSGTQWAMPAEDLAAGVYWLEAVSEKKKWTQKIIIQ